MKTLLYVPVIHSNVDLGSLAGEVAKQGISDLGKDFWQEYVETVERFWDSIFCYFESIDVSGMKIYQDGMVAEGEIGGKIVEEGLKSGSRNYELVSKLINRGAILVKTEDFKLVKEERDRIVAITRAKSISGKLAAFIKYKLVKKRLLKKRDDFITKRIDDTLKHGDKGVLFIGAFHDIKKGLSNKYLIKEIKSIDKVREYQKLLPFSHKRREQFQELGRYLVSNPKPEV